MDWDLKVSEKVAPRQVQQDGKSVVFGQLLDNLRTIHEEVCARNAQLEIHAVSGNAARLDNMQPELWLPSNFVAPKEGPPPRRPLRATSTPRSFMIQATDVVAGQQEYLIQSVEKLVERQDILSEQMTHIESRILTLNAEPNNSKQEVSRPGTGPKKLSSRLQDPKQSIISEKRASAAEAEHDSAAEGKRSSAAEVEKDTVRFTARRASADVIEHKRSEEESKKRRSRRSELLARATMRFRVQTGNTRDLAQSVRSWETGQMQNPGQLFRFRTCFQEVLNSAAFNFLSALLILSYAGLIALETEMMAEDPETDSPAIKISHYVYTTIFFAELMLRLGADGWAALCGEDALWNRLDAFFILSGLAEMLMESLFGSTKVASAGSIVRGVRIFRVFRTIRLLRSFTKFYEFQKMAYALISSVKTLLCSLALLLFVMYFFAVFFTQIAADNEKREQIAALELRYGSLTSTIYSLFLSVSGGISWDECYMPLYHCSLLASLGFIFYIVVVLFGVLNVVTSIFVESVIRSVQHYKDLIVKDKEEEKKIAVGHVSEVFRQIDVDGSGVIEVEEMEHFLAEPALRKYLEALDIDASDTRLLFRLLDYDDSGVINTQEFCDGCLKLKGNAKGLDIHALAWQVKNFLSKWGEFTGYVEENFMTIKDGLKKRPGSLK